MDLDKIQSFYSNIQLPIPTEEDVDAATEKVKKILVPLSVRRNLQRHIYKLEDNGYWEKHGYGELHRWRCHTKASGSPLATTEPTADQRLWSLVGRLLNHPLARTAVDCCLIARVDIEKLALTVPQVFQIPITEKAIETYRKFLFNVEHFTRADWMDYLKRIEDDKYVYTRVFAALTKPREEVLHLVGLPNDKQYSDFLRNVLAVASYKMNAYSRQNTLESDNQARKWAKVGFEAGEKFEKYGASDVSDFAKLVQTEFEYVDPNIPTIDSNIAANLRPALGEAGDDKPKPEPS